MGAANEKSHPAREAMRRIVHSIKAGDDARVHLIGERRGNLFEKRVGVRDVVVNRSARDPGCMRKFAHVRMSRSPEHEDAHGGFVNSSLNRRLRIHIEHHLTELNIYVQ